MYAGIEIAVDTETFVVVFLQRSSAKGGVRTFNSPSRACPQPQEVTDMRVSNLACSECKQRNYNTMKNKKNDPDRLEFSKYCRFCKKHTEHKETK